MFFNLDKKDMAFIKQPISKTKEGENETGFIPRITEILFIKLFQVSSST